MGRESDAVSSLTQLLDFSPTDTEAWAELADLYVSQGLYPQAVFALEEVLVKAPNAWNVSNLSLPVRLVLSCADERLQIHARLGEVLYMAATASGTIEGSVQKYLAESLKRFSRSIELCDDYLRGYYGLKLVRSGPYPVPSSVVAVALSDSKLDYVEAAESAGQVSKADRLGRLRPSRYSHN